MTEYITGNNPEGTQVKIGLVQEGNGVEVTATNDGATESWIIGRVDNATGKFVLYEIPHVNAVGLDVDTTGHVKCVRV